MAIEYGNISEVGKVRNMNQDSVFTDAKGDMGIFMVADGMGGHCRGEIASNCVAEMLGSWWKRNYIPNMKMDFQDLVDQVGELIQQMNSVVFETYQKKELKGGTTVSILIIRKEQYAIFTIGDSRIYKKQKRKFLQISVDDVWENLPENIDKEMDELGKDRRYGTLTQALGYDSQVVPRIMTDKLEKDDIFVICSDGVYKYISCEKMSKIVSKYVKKRNISDALENVKSEIYQAGAGDNFSCILVKA